MKSPQFVLVGLKQHAKIWNLLTLLRLKYNVNLKTSFFRSVVCLVWLFELMLKQLHIISSRPYINCWLYKHLYKGNISRKPHPYITTQHPIMGTYRPKCTQFQTAQLFQARFIYTFQTVMSTCKITLQSYIVTLLKITWRLN